MELGDENENKMIKTRQNMMEKRMTIQKSHNVRIVENQCQILIPMTQYVVITAQVQAEKKG